MPQRFLLAIAVAAWVGLSDTDFAGADERQAPLPVRAITLDGPPSEMALHEGKLYLGSFAGKNLTVFDVAKRRPLQKLHLDAYESGTDREQDELRLAKREVRLYPPGDLVAANGKLFVGQLFSGHVVVFDLATMWVVKRIPVGGEGHFAASADGKTVFFASNEKHEFHAIDTRTYKVETVPYPDGGRGIGAVAVSPDQKWLYLGIQRGGKAPDGKEHGGGNSFLAAYDLERRRYAGTLYLAEIDEAGTSDDSIPREIVFSADGKRMFVGMFQSRAGIYEIDPANLKVVRKAVFAVNAKNLFPWVDPLGLATYREWLLSANRNNREVMVLDGETLRPVARLTFEDQNRCIARIVVAEDRIYLGDQDAGRMYELDGRKLSKRLKGVTPGEGKPPLELTLDD